MRVIVNDNEVNIPSTLDEITLDQKILFHYEHGDLLDQMLKSIYEIEDEFERDLELVQFQAEKTYRIFSFFSGVPLEVVKESDLKVEVTNVYLKMNLDEEVIELKREFEWFGETWCLDSPEIVQGNPLKCRQFIEAKQMVQQMTKAGASKWECLVPLAAIFLLKKGESYDKTFIFKGSERLELMKTLPMSVAIHVSFFFDNLNEYAANYFPIFWPSRIKISNAYTKKHMEQWGWVNFVKEIAKTKEFDVDGSGMNSIDCVLESPLFDVLLFASEEKELSEAQYLDHEAERQKKK